MPKTKTTFKILVAFVILGTIIFIVFLVQGLVSFKRQNTTNLHITGKYFETYFNDQKVDFNNSQVPAAVLLAADSLEKNYQRILTDFRLSKFPKFNFQIYSNPQKYLAAIKEKNLWTEVLQQQTDTSEGTVWQSQIIFYYLPENFLGSADYHSSIIMPPHEFTHLVQNYLYGNKGPDIPPIWFREGSAVWEAQQLSEEDRKIFSEAKSKNQTLTFFQINQENPVNNPSLFYATVGLFYEYLFSNYGKNQINDIFRNSGYGTAFDNLFLKVTKKQASDLYQEWLDTL